MAPREPLKRVSSDAELNERENETDERGGKRDAKPVALVALPGETLGCLLFTVLRAAFYIILNRYSLA